MSGQIPTTAAEVLDRAADVIKERGLHQGALMPPDGVPSRCQVCTLGAINVALNGNPMAVPPRLRSLRTSARNLLAQQIGAPRDHSGAIALWPDTLGRTDGQVIQALRLAAKAARTEAVR